VISSSKLSEGLRVWSSKPGKDGLLVWDSKLDRDGLMEALKPSVAGLIGLGLKNQGVADRQTRGGISKLASRRSDVEKTPGPLDQCRKT
jgi:hypothetical protein